MLDEDMEIAESSARGGVFLLTGNVLSLIVLAIGSVVVPRLLGPENYGLYALSLVMPSMLASLLDLGVNPALTRFSAKLRVENKSPNVAGIIRSAFIYKVATGTAVSVFCFVLSNILATHILKRPEIDLYIKLASISIAFQTVYYALDSTFLGLERMEGSAVLRNIQAITKVALSPLLIILGFGIVGALSGHVTSYLIALVSGVFILFRIYRSLGGNIGAVLPNIKSMLSYGFPLHAAAVLSLFLALYQSVVLAFYASNVEIGNFTIAVNLSSLLTSLVFPLEVLFPAFSKVDLARSGQIQNIFRFSVKYTALFIIPATVFAVTLSKDIVYTLYGHGYVSAPFYIQLYALAYLYTGIGSVVLGSMFSGIGQTRVAFISSLINLVVFIPLSIMLTNTYGVPGLITAYLASSTVSVCYSLIVAVRKIQVRVDFGSSLRIYLASLLSAVPVLTLLNTSPLGNLMNLVVNGPIYLLTYLTLLPLTGAIHQTDLDNFRMMFSRRKAVWPLLRPTLAYEAKLTSISRRNLTRSPQSQIN